MQITAPAVFQHAPHIITTMGCPLWLLCLALQLQSQFSSHFLKKSVHIHVQLFAYLSLCTGSGEATLPAKQMHRRRRHLDFQASSQISQQLGYYELVHFVTINMKHHKPSVWLHLTRIWDYIAVLLLQKALPFSQSSMFLSSTNAFQVS